MVAHVAYVVFNLVDGRIHRLHILRVGEFFTFRSLEYDVDGHALCGVFSTGEVLQQHVCGTFRGHTGNREAVGEPLLHGSGEAADNSQQDQPHAQHKPVPTV